MKQLTFFNHVNAVNNGVIQHTYLFNPTTAWVNRFAVERYLENRSTFDFDPTTLGFPSVLREGFKDLFTPIDVEDFGMLGTEVCVDVTEAHTMPHYSSTLNKVFGSHNLKFGGEQRIVLVNYFQPCFPRRPFFRFRALQHLRTFLAPVTCREMHWHPCC